MNRREVGRLRDGLLVIGPIGGKLGVRSRHCLNSVPVRDTVARRDDV
jgi:hypothetical protein